MSINPEISAMRWPQSDTSLFGIEGELIAETPASGKEWGRFADAYLMAAESVVRSLQSDESDPPSRIDYLVYPIIFLYRHFVELRLKEIILTGQELTRDSTACDQNHDLIHLWKHARRILITVFPNDPVEDLDNIERLILSFSSVDPGSFAFRYPTRKNSEVQYNYGHDKISIQQFSEALAKLARFLGAVSFAISNYLDICIQNDREHRSQD